ncbi:MAG: hypothetical protein V1809_02115 [Planctomycetota bacterium]
MSACSSVATRRASSASPKKARSSRKENPTIGLLLCQSKKQTVVELTLPKDANIHAREYQLYLPSKELLRQKLLDWTREAESPE